MIAVRDYRIEICNGPTTPSLHIDETALVCMPEIVLTTDPLGPCLIHDASAQARQIRCRETNGVGRGNFDQFAVSEHNNTARKTWRKHRSRRIRYALSAVSRRTRMGSKIKASECEIMRE